MSNLLTTTLVLLEVAQMETKKHTSHLDPSFKCSALDMLVPVRSSISIISQATTYEGKQNSGRSTCILSILPKKKKKEKKNRA